MCFFIVVCVFDPVGSVSLLPIGGSYNATSSHQFEVGALRLVRQSYLCDMCVVEWCEAHEHFSCYTCTHSNSDGGGERKWQTSVTQGLEDENVVRVMLSVMSR